MTTEAERSKAHTRAMGKSERATDADEVRWRWSVSQRPIQPHRTWSGRCGWIAQEYSVCHRNVTTYSKADRDSLEGILEVLGGLSFTLLKMVWL